MPEPCREILGVRVDCTNYPAATREILEWAKTGRSRYVCCACVHSVMEAHDSKEYRTVIRSAHLVTADGMPVVWLLRRLGFPSASRVYGPDLMINVLEAATKASIPVGFYGASEVVLRQLLRRVAARFPALDIVFAEAPPFRLPTPAEDEKTTRAINQSGARILFIGLGTPKQDRWMHAHLGRVTAVMLGVGAAFDFLARAKPQAPRWMQASGLEWLFRFAWEPRRLWRRYLLHNPRFAILAISQLLRQR